MVLYFDMLAIMLRAMKVLKHSWQRELAQTGLAKPIGWLPKAQVTISDPINCGGGGASESVNWTFFLLWQPNDFSLELNLPR